jgi:hypothetical protein
MGNTVANPQAFNTSDVAVTYEPSPMFIQTSTGDKGLDGIIERINEGKNLYVDLRLHGKTQVTVSLKAPGVGLNISTAHTAGNPYKMVVKSEHNWYTGQNRNVHYFKLSKKQGLKQLEDYLRRAITVIAAVNNAHYEGINLVIWETNALRQIRDTYPGV